MRLHLQMMTGQHIHGCGHHGTYAHYPWWDVPLPFLQVEIQKGDLGCAKSHPTNLLGLQFQSSSQDGAPDLPTLPSSTYTAIPLRYMPWMGTSVLFPVP